MIRAVAILAALALAAPAHAATTTSAGPYVLMKGGGQLQSFQTQAACETAANSALVSESEAQARSAKRYCRIEINSTYSATPPPVIDCVATAFGAWLETNRVTNLDGTVTVTEQRTKSIITGASGGGSIAACTPLVEVRFSNIAAPAYTLLANETELFGLSKTATVRFGKLPSSFITASITSGTKTCNLALFSPQADPSPGNAKICQIIDITAVIPPNTGMPNVGPAINLASIPAPRAGITRQIIDTVPAQGITGDGTGAFRLTIGFSHMAFNDPIVLPGQPGASHCHAFFGNTSTDAYTTTASLAASGSSTAAGGTINLSSYWMPCMVDNATHNVVVPTDMVVYYKGTYNNIPRSGIVWPPNGLRMVAGNKSTATGFVDWWGIHPTFRCDAPGYPAVNSLTIPPDCPPGGKIVFTVDYPYCWDGVNYDSPDHRSHMYVDSGLCPPSHPVNIVAYSQHADYPVGASGTANWRLSSDNYSTSDPAGWSAHGDVWFQWDPAISAKILTNCISTGGDCHGQLISPTEYLGVP